MTFGIEDVKCSRTPYGFDRSGFYAGSAQPEMSDINIFDLN
jgi:hypothetical protein